MSELIDSVVGYVVDPTGTRVALLHKNRPDYLKGLWMGIAGKVDPGETPEQAMRREFQEEAGVDIEKWTLVKILDKPETPCNLHVFFACHDLDNVRTVTDEEVRVFQLDQLDGLTFGNAFTEIREQLMNWAESIRRDNSRRSLALPLLFMRCDDLRFGSSDGTPQRKYIVVLPDHMDFTYINTAWQDNPDFPEGSIFRPSIDILSKERTFIFDSMDSEENYRNAVAKMKELWAQVNLDQ